MIDALILAGERAMFRRAQVPKALMRVNGKELIAHQIDYLKDKVSRIIVSTGIGDSAKEIEDFVYESYPELAIICVPENQPLGTAGAIKNCVGVVETDRVLVVNCDDICDIDLVELDKLFGDIICVRSPQLQFGIIKQNFPDEEKVLGRYSFVEKPILKGLWTSCGWYLLKKKTIRQFPVKGSIEYNVFPKLNFNVYKHLGKWHTFNTQKDVEVFEMNGGKI
ncbi:MAG: NTP transferase domain-containing protein [archaeon]|nr:NTP transferase domain-containing protein [archaeon]MCR4323589.1 NTP transferase domain-containing protein [Nanoarchaeota archaeon]